MGPSYPQNRVHLTTAHAERAPSMPEVRPMTPRSNRPANRRTCGPTTRKDQLGRRGEEIAARYLAVRLGWTILARNWRCPEGEIDIIAFDGRRQVVCEVKTRSSLTYGAPIEAITTAKATRLRRLAGRWAEQHGLRSDGIRVDVIGVLGDDQDGFTIDHVREVC
jgi:putative endonuclease